MTTVAVAGGTGGVGKTLVETLEQQSKFRVIVLSRSVSDRDENFQLHAC